MATSQGDLQGSNSGNAPSWPQLLGSDHWSGLLEPLDLALRRLILLAGDLCQVTYDSFNADTHSAYCGSCRYSKSSLFHRTAFPVADDITVASYVYATSEVSLPAGLMLFSLSREAWSKESNWIGYVAVSSDAAAAAIGRRVIYIAWRGTIRTLEWVDVLEPELVDIGDILSSSNGDDDGDGGPPKVMKGWHVMYTSSDEKSPFSKLSARDQMLAAARELVARYKNQSLSIVCVGHSLGAALAMLCAFDIVENGLSKVGDEHVPVAAIVFGSPQIGNPAFKKRFEELPNLRALHVKNKPDLIPLYPSGLLGYANVGDLLVVDSKKSPFLKPMTTNVGDYHNLQGILHTVAGWNGEGAAFELRVQRSVALVNKSCAYLKDECLVPESWWVEKNKGLVLGADGEWRFAPPAEEDLPVPPSTSGKVIDGDIATGGSGGRKETEQPVETKKKGKAGTRLLPSCGACFRGRGAN